MGEVSQAPTATGLEPALRLRRHCCAQCGELPMWPLWGRGKTKLCVCVGGCRVLHYEALIVLELTMQSRLY